MRLGAVVVPTRVCVQMQFDLAEEYVELLYRQFIVLLGMTTFPLITALGAVGYVIECVFPIVWRTRGRHGVTVGC